MAHISNYLQNVQRPSDDSDDTKYTLVMHGLCKKYKVESPLARHIFSILENMSRYGRPCLYTNLRLSEYSGGSEADIETLLQLFESGGIIEQKMLKQTRGWKLTNEVRASADWIKQKIESKRRG